MKIRTDFVTNSSSSSFIIACSNIDFNEYKKKYENDILITCLLDNMLSAFTNNVNLVWNNVDEYKSYFVKEYIYDDISLEEFLENDSYYKDIFYEVVEAIEKGHNVYNFVLDNYDNSDFIRIFSKLPQDVKSPIYVIEKEVY